MTTLRHVLDTNNIHVKGILHIGANYCQEQAEYEKITSPSAIFWVEANPHIVESIKRDQPSYNIYQALLTDVSGMTVDFHISNNNGLSSSIFEFEKHKISHPSINFTESIKLETTTLDDLKFNGEPNILVMDVQGAEVLVLKGATKSINNFDVICTEINTDYTYKGCGLLTELNMLLEQRGFKQVYSHIWQGHTYGDAIYVRTELLVSS